MKNPLRIALVLFMIASCSSCNKDEGLGGRSTIEGKVFKVIHTDDNLTLTTDTVPAGESDVYLVFGNDAFYGDDTKAGRDGFYQFRYLNGGNYTIYAYNKYPSGAKEAVTKSVHVGNRSTARVENIYIHEGKAFGTSIIKGNVEVHYYKKDVLVDIGPGHEIRMYIQKVGDDTFFNDVRVGENGVFAFQKVEPGEYEIYTYTEDIDTEALSPVKQSIVVNKAGEIVMMPEKFIIVIHV